MAPSSLRSRTGCLTCKNRRKKCDEGRPVCERCKKGGFDCLGYEHHNRRPPGVDQAQTPPSASSATSPGSSAPPQASSSAMDITETFPGSIDTDISTPGAGSSSSTAPPPLMNLQSGFTGLNPSNGALPSPNGTGLSGLQSFLDSLGPPPANDVQLDGLMPSGLDGTDMFSGFGNLLGMGMPSLPNFGQPTVPYAHIESTDAEPGLGASTAPSDAAFNELGAELIASHQTVARPHEGLLLADDEEDDIDPEGLLAEVERSMRTIKLDSGEHLNELYDFYLMFFSRLVFEPVRIYQNLASVLLERFQTSEVMRHSMLAIAYLYRSIYDRAASAAVLQTHAQKLHEIARKQLQSDIQNPQLPPSVKLSGIIEVLFFEYSSGGCNSYYRLLEQARPYVRSLVGGDVIDFMSLRGKQTFDIRIFAWCDILSAMALSRPTLFTYETEIEHMLTVDPDNPIIIPLDDDVGLEWMVGCPNVMIVLMARISALRDKAISQQEKIILAEAIEKSIRAWQARPSPTTNSFLKVVRMSAQEIWRHAMILFLYHAIHKVGPLHRVIKDAVRQIISLAQTIPAGRNPDIFLPVPYFLAGAACISRKDRMFLRSRLSGCGKERALLDLVAVLDDVWKEMDETGNSVDWSARAAPAMFQL
ncbi:fungal-specific transcription factor domain protein [Rhizoctonia solani 123E]|uniref:Fungal-specific transcription factor domain protein n=1 Tax=Rhizoctonia solani 123E TaxID=1423351 RepID=A0A074RQE6_9AGAM|nr:fungal-specific transcription factor domain protein [Rhizoctonia solani 123E]